jgi:hypothetical protein
MERKSFMVYMTWEEQIDLMDDVELRRFFKNLFRFHKGEEVEMPTKTEKLTWLGILPALKTNWDKYEQKVAANSENGKKGGAPKGNKNASKSKTTQNNPNNPIKGKREKKSDNSKKKKENCEKETDDNEQEQGKLELIADGATTSTYTGKYTGTCLQDAEIDEINKKMNTVYGDADPETKDTFFKWGVMDRIHEKLIATGYFEYNFYQYVKPENLSDIERKLTPVAYKSIKPLLLEYMKLKFNYTF